MKMSHIIILAIVALVTFPVMYVSMLIMKGNLKVVYNVPENSAAREQAVFGLLKQKQQKDSLVMSQSSTFRALQQQQAELQEERKHLAQEEQRIALLKDEMDKSGQELALKKKEIEVTVDTNKALEDKKIKQLAKVYGTMRAAEAAQILETLDDKLLTKILMNISDDRQKAKILGALSKEKAAAVSTQMGKLSSR